jgi:Glycerophosphoryl diester phosphodiesterase
MGADSFICFGHRGAKGYAPENTLAAFQKALELGVPWVELDVYLVEGQLVVIHDQRLERTTNGRGYVQEQSLSYLRSLDAGLGQPIPLLYEVLDLIDRRAGVNVELKGPGTAPAVVNLIEEYVLERGWEEEQFIVSSFDHQALSMAKRCRPSLKIGALIAGIPLHLAAFATELNAYCVNASLDFINQAFVEDTHERGMRMFVYTVNLLEDIKRMKALGVDGVFTDFPDQVVHAAGAAVDG